ncbi:esterase/lipase family protein [Sphingopyxis sp. 113P3]|uniref:esterase/lipase family protein n=1 Tax=Sphingopyxis sp. (strain 113P3) TaxID=292913 RepID=UPI0006AD432C|nr:alpha/beta fold hydrolase [Sphingopyxis sp. 113P3]ALC13359.1 alpha/beta hydrolase [Sphingopyxis sp. 113P3]
MTRTFCSLGTRKSASLPGTDAPPPLALLWGEAGGLLRALCGRVGRLGRIPNPDSPHPPVMVLPGFLSGDWATRTLRADLRRAGFRCYAWGLGFNRGATADLLERIDGRVEWIIARTGRAPALVGWSLGGIYAREYAKHHPDKVARVVTLGSPFSGSRRANRAWRLYHAVARHPVECPPVDFHPAPRPAIPTFALWSPRDGIVAPGSARGLPSESDRQVEVDCSHMGFAYAPASVAAIVTALTEEASARA